MLKIKALSKSSFRKNNSFESRRLKIISPEEDLKSSGWRKSSLWIQNALLSFFLQFFRKSTTFSLKRCRKCQKRNFRRRLWNEKKSWSLIWVEWWISDFVLKSVEFSNFGKMFYPPIRHQKLAVFWNFQSPTHNLYVGCWKFHHRAELWCRMGGKFFFRSSKILRFLGIKSEIRQLIALNWVLLNPSRYL